MKFCKLILTKIIKIVETRCLISRLKYTKFDFGWGSAQTPPGELTALPRPPDPLAGGEGAGCLLPDNHTLAFGPSGLNTSVPAAIAIFPRISGC